MNDLKEIKRQDFTERIKRRNKKPKFICELLTDDNEIIRTYCWNEELPEKVEILLGVEDGNIYTTREATAKELEELMKGNMELQRPDGESYPVFIQEDGTLADKIVILREKTYNPYKK